MTIPINILVDGVRLSRGHADFRVYRSADRGGLTVYKQGKVASLTVPVDATAHARTVRLHELLHAAHSKARRRPVPLLVANAIEDCYVHLTYWPQELPRAPSRRTGNRSCRHPRHGGPIRGRCR